MTKVEELNEALLLSKLSYADGVEKLQSRLEMLHCHGWEKENANKPQWELLLCDAKSRPNEPSHLLVWVVLGLESIYFASGGLFRHLRRKIPTVSALQCERKGCTRTYIGFLSTSWMNIQWWTLTSNR